MDFIAFTYSNHEIVRPWPVGTGYHLFTSLYYMNGIKDHCTPRQDLLTGVFNPEVFTPSLSDVLSCYADGGKPGATVYTDPVQFFRDATFPSSRLVEITKEVFRRLQEDNSFGATQRLETSFGGGKTHALIALAHLSQRGTELADHVSDWFPAELLPSPGDIRLVGLVGERLKITEYRGSEAEPWTLWREIAFQIDPAFANEAWAQSRESPEVGGPWFRNVLGGKKVLLLIDELAVYATRLAAARPSEASQVSTFLKTLFDYARAQTGVVTVFTLASLKDAFRTQTEEIRKAIGNETGEEVSVEEAERLMRAGTEDLESVSKRDENARPVLAPEELAKVFTKRLFDRIDETGAREAAELYGAAYARWESDLPREAVGDELKRRIIDCYPFHPTFIDYLYEKLSSVENFQGTRGVLQTMSVVLRALWVDETANPVAIQVGDVDLRAERVNDMLLSRTKSIDLEPALSTDIGGLGKGEQHAARLDRENPNPAEPRWHEKVWRVVFLNSLAGRAMGLQSKLFGVTEPDACLQAVHPQLSPALVKKALEAVKDVAWFLKCREGRYFCDLDPTVARIVSSVKEGLHNKEGTAKANGQIVALARSMLKEIAPFRVYAERVNSPSDVPDEQEQPTVVVIDHTAGKISLTDFYTQTGRGARSHQNPLIFLVPDSVVVSEADVTQADMFDRRKRQLEELLERSLDVLARKQIKANPERYQLRRRVLQDEDFDGELTTKEQELRGLVARLYSKYYYPAYGSGAPTSGNLTAVGTEGGLDIFPTIEKRLKERNKLLTEENVKHRVQRLEVAKQIFERKSIRRLKEAAGGFWKNRAWPMLASPAVLGPLIRAGIEDEQWAVVYQETLDSEPTAVYSKRQPLPFDIHTSDLWEDAGYSIARIDEARKRGWLDEQKKLDPLEIISRTLSPDVPATVDEFSQAVKNHLPEGGEATEEDLRVILRDGLEAGKIVLVKGTLDAPGAIIDSTHGLGGERLADGGWKIVNKDLARGKGLLAAAGGDHGDLTLRDDAFAALHPKLAKFELWSRGMKGRLTLEMQDVALIDGGGRVDLVLRGLDEAGMVAAQELLEVFAARTRVDDQALFTLTLTDAEDCPFAEKLRAAVDE